MGRLEHWGNKQQKQHCVDSASQDAAIAHHKHLSIEGSMEEEGVAEAQNQAALERLRAQSGSR
jgi:hypothetical protein